MKRFIPLLFMIALMMQSTSCKNAATEQKNDIIQNKWQSFNTIDENGLLGERVDLWRNKRMWYMANSGHLIQGFENRTKSLGWHGEHIGKWLHAATLAYQVTKDEKLKKELDETVQRLIVTQLPNGYLGTTIESENMVTFPERNGWDVWVHRYNIYGLLSYEKYFPNDEVVEVCKKMGDLLIEIYGKGKADITKHGSRQGISAMTLLESIVMLYQRTGEKKYLDFAEHIVAMCEKNSRLKVMSNMLDGESVVYSGDGKAYQLMATLLGYLQLYRCTDNEDYLTTVMNGWEDVKRNHLTTAGGPWGRVMPYNGNGECFAHTDGFHPAVVKVEGCSGATWVKLNLHLFELTGEAKYMNEVELTMFNDLIGHQHADGIQWVYYSIPNDTRLNMYKHTIKYHCCASSMPRAIEMFSNYLAGSMEDALSIGSLSPADVEIPDKFGGGTVEIKGNYPHESSAEIYFKPEKTKRFTLEFHLPVFTKLEAVKVNGKTTIAKMNDRGFYEVEKKWKKGDVLSIDMNYQLKATIQLGENDSRWVAFSYGPLALAESIHGEPSPQPEPFLDVDPQTTPSEYSAMLTKSSERIFTIKGTEITLIPYYQTCSMESRPRTYFKLVNSGKKADIVN